MKNRIWKQMKKAGIVTVLAGAMLGGTIEPELTLGADFLPGQAPFIDQSVFWKDIESGQAELGIRIRGHHPPPDGLLQARQRQYQD